MRGLFVNQEKNNCSIYESGMMIYNALKSDDTYELDIAYVPIRQIDTFDYGQYDFYVFNWHHNTLPISKATLDRIKGIKIGILLEVGYADMKPFMREDLFDAYMVLDPTKEPEGKFYPFPRPLEEAEKLLPLLSDTIPVFGTFGFLVQGKNFGEVLQVANNLGSKCILRMNFPDARFTGVPFNMVKDFAKRLYSFKSDNVELIITHDYMDKSDLIAWCSEHWLNVFPYYRDMPGLSATTDQAISAGRGIAVTNCNTFRHLHKYIGYYPKESYMQLCESTLHGVAKMKLDWSRTEFTDTFIEMLRSLI